LFVPGPAFFPHRKLQDDAVGVEKYRFPSPERFAQGFGITGDLCGKGVDQ
jgi:hypothetical protein